MKPRERFEMQRSRSHNRLIETAFVSSNSNGSIDNPVPVPDMDEVDRLANHPVLRTVKEEEKYYKLRKSKSECGEGFAARRYCGMSVFVEETRSAADARSIRSLTASSLLRPSTAEDATSAHSSVSSASHYSNMMMMNNRLLLRPPENSMTRSASGAMSDASSWVFQSHYRPHQEQQRVKAGLEQNQRSPSRPADDVRSAHSSMSSASHVNLNRMQMTAEKPISTDNKKASSSGIASSSVADAVGWNFQLCYRPHQELQLVKAVIEQNQRTPLRPEDDVRSTNSSISSASRLNLNRMQPAAEKPIAADNKKASSGGIASSSVGDASSWVFQSHFRPQAEQPPPQQQQQQNNVKVVQAVIEHHQRPSCFTPPATTAAAATPAAPENKTPPNTAPMPLKFGSVRRVPQNLLAAQKTQGGGGEKAAVPVRGDESKGRMSCKKRLHLSLKAKLKLDKKDADSSSAESTPAKANNNNKNKNKNKLAMAPKQVQELTTSTSGRSKFFSSGESSCSSSLESIQSMVSSSVSSQCSCDEVNANSNHVNAVKKFQNMLSPISDKSQEQSNGETPKVSPVEQQQQHLTNNQLNNNVGNDNDNGNEGGQVVMARALDVPWEMPKLRRKLHQQQEQQRRKTLDLQGSDSGISIASQDLKEISELLNVPWSMPKLRKRAQNLLTTDNNNRPQSMLLPQPQIQNPSEEEEPRPVSTPITSTAIETTNNDKVEECGFPSAASNEAPPTERLSLPVAYEPGSSPHPPPPPGFEDEFYLHENNRASFPLTGNHAKKERPKMTLTFGVDPSVKTLMFATNSPFSLNDCEEVDPNVPMDRQE